MDELIAALTQIIVAVLDGVREVGNAVISAFSTPASWIGMSPEVLVAVLTAIVLVVVWRSVGGKA